MPRFEHIPVGSTSLDDLYTLRTRRSSIRAGAEAGVTANGENEPLVRDLAVFEAEVDAERFIMAREKMKIGLNCFN